MTKQEANYQSVLVCASFLIAFIGVAHEVIGPTLFPWGPEWFGAFLWHTIGVAAISAGLLFLAATFGEIRIPVVPLAVLTGIGCLAAVGLMAFKENEFHYFALWAAIAAFTVANTYPKFDRLRRAG